MKVVWSMSNPLFEKKIWAWHLSKAVGTRFICVRDSKVHGAKMETTWVLSAPDGPHVGPVNLAIRVVCVLQDGADLILWNRISVL